MIPFAWNEKAQTLTISKLQGAYAGYRRKRIFNIVFVSEGSGAGIADAAIKKVVAYTGKSIMQKNR